MFHETYFFYLIAGFPDVGFSCRAFLFNPPLDVFIRIRFGVSASKSLSHKLGRIVLSTGGIVTVPYGSQNIGYTRSGDFPPTTCKPFFASLFQSNSSKIKGAAGQPLATHPYLVHRIYPNAALPAVLPFGPKPCPLCGT
jgi:hypothetical protein